MRVTLVTAGSDLVTAKPASVTFRLSTNLLGLIITGDFAVPGDVQERISNAALRGVEAASMRRDRLGSKANEKFSGRSTQLRAHRILLAISARVTVAGNDSDDAVFARDGILLWARSRSQEFVQINITPSGEREKDSVG
jgi:hypothetical protein